MLRAVAAWLRIWSFRDSHYALLFSRLRPATSRGAINEPFAQKRLQNLFENTQPIPTQNFYDIDVTESAVDQFAGKIARMRMTG